MDNPEHPPRRGFPTGQRSRQGTKVTNVNVDAFNAIMANNYDAKSNLDVARRLGCSEGTVSRIRSGDKKPGNAFFSCVGATVTREEFFEIFAFQDVKEPVAA